MVSKITLFGDFTKVNIGVQEKKHFLVLFSTKKIRHINTIFHSLMKVLFDVNSGD